jgi:hypothetical protein
VTVRQPCYSKGEFARCGDEIYESQVRPQVEAGNHGKIVALNIETGAFERLEGSAKTAYPIKSMKLSMRGNTNG